MSWPQHKYAFIVLDGWSEPVRDNGQGKFVGGGFAEVFLNRKAAKFVADEERKGWDVLIKYDAQGKREAWIQHKKNVKIIRIALPGTYPQVNIEALRALQQEEKKQKRLRFPKSK